MGHASKERVVLIGTDRRVTSGPAARTAAFRSRIHGCTRTIRGNGASERVFAEQQTAPNYGYLFEMSADRKRIVGCAHISAIGGDSDNLDGDAEHGLVSAPVAAAKQAMPLIPIVFANPNLLLDEVGTTLNLIARAPRHDRHCGGRVLR
jgi:hypothetical protein